MTDFNKPTLKQLKNQAVSLINANLKGADALLRHSLLGVLASVMAGIGDEILRRVEYLLRQTFVKDAEAEFLIKHGETHAFPRKLATFAQGKIRFDASISGSVVKSDTELKRSDNVVYVSKSEARVKADGTLEIPVIAKNVGKDGNAEAGTVFSFITPIAGVNSRGIADEDGITGGADIEDIEAYRERLLFFIRNPSTGGSKTDYEIWAKEVHGVTRAWCYPTESGAGTVTVRFMMDGTYPDGIPQAPDIERVRNHIAALQPATAIVYIEAPVPKPINFIFSKLIPNTEEARLSVKTNILNLIKSSTFAPGETLKLSKIRAAVSNATGNEDFNLLAPNTDIISEVGHIPVLGEITYLEDE